MSSLMDDIKLGRCSRYAALVLIWLCCQLAGYSTISAAEPDSSDSETSYAEVLVLHSYHEGLAWTDGLQEHITAHLKANADSPIRIHTEYLDTKRHPLGANEAEVIALLKAKSQRIKPNVIIVTDNNALSLVMKYRDELYSSVPVVFCGINGFHDRMIDRSGDFTGVLEYVQVSGSVDLAKRLSPGLKRMIILSDKTPTGVNQLADARKQLGDEYEGIQIEYWTDLSFESLAEKLGQLSATADAVFLTAYNRDALNQFKSHRDAASFISSASKAPVYGGHDFYLGTGVVGGEMVSSKEQGEIAAAKALRVLNGERPVNIAMVRDSPNAMMVDHLAMQKWGFDHARLPVGTVEVNHPQSIWASHRETILWALSVMVLEAIALIILGALLFRTRLRATQSIAKREMRYAIAQQAAKICSWEWNLTECTLEWSDQAKIALGLDPKKWGSNIDAFYEDVHEDDRESLKGHIMLAAKEHSDIRTEYRIKGDDGEYHWKLSRGEVVCNEQGEAEKIIGITQDISDRRRMEKLYESFYQAMRASSNPMLITDDEGNIRHINPAFQHLFGLGMDDVRHQSLWDLNAAREVYQDMGVSDRIYEELHQAYIEVILGKSKREWHGDMLGQTRYGHTLNLRMSLSAIEGPNHVVQGYVAIPMDVTQQRAEQHHILLECYKALSSLAETRDDETGLHLKRISLLCEQIARAYGQSKKFCEDIAIYSELHDIGKVGIPDAILLAPRKLTSEEFEIMKSHAVLGHKILDGRPTLEMAADIARWHHEHWDGRGYPDGLEGEIIPLSARIMAIADVYDALRSKRRYKDSWTHQETMDYLKSKAGTQFDPALIDAFVSISENITLSYQPASAEE